MKATGAGIDGSCQYPLDLAGAALMLRKWNCLNEPETLRHGPACTHRRERARYRSRMRIFLACLLLATRALGGEAPSEESDGDRTVKHRWEFSLETAQMVGVDNRNHYYFSTQMLNLAWEPFRPLRLGPVRLRHQLVGTFFAAAILSGPESYYFGGGLQLRLIIPLVTIPAFPLCK